MFHVFMMQNGDQEKFLIGKFVTLSAAEVFKNKCYKKQLRDTFVYWDTKYKIEEIDELSNKERAP